MIMHCAREVDAGLSYLEWDKLDKIYKSFSFIYLV